MKRVLVVDDSMLWRQFVSDIVRKEGYEVRVATDGVEGYKTAIEYVPDIVFLDVEMPGMRGYTLCRLLRNEPAFKDAGIIIMTSLDETLNRFWAMKAGASGFIQKGINSERMTEGIKEHLKKDYKSYPDLIDPTKAYRFEEINNILEDIILRETIKAEIYSLYSYLSDEEHVFWKVSDFLFQILPLNVLAIMTLSPHEGFLFIHSKERKVDETKVKGLLFSALSRPVYPAEWKIYGGNYGGDYLPKIEPYILRDRNKTEVGVLAVEGNLTFEDREIIVDVVENIGELFKLVTSYSSAVKQAKYDELTKLLNFRTLMEKLSEYFQIAKRTREPLSVAMIDIDNFKKVNDTYGHLIGNEVLKKLAVIMKESFRQVDIIGRYGGEEFAVGMVNTPLESAKIAAERFRKNVEEFDWERIQKGMKITVSVGLASTLDDFNPRTIVEVIEAADEALYEAKRTGKNKVVVYGS